MSDSSPPSIVVFCEESFVLERVRDVAQASSAWQGSVQMEAAKGHPAGVVRWARERHGRSPIGILVSDEANALLAIEAGADEALVAGVVDEQTVLGFFDRVMLRARLRREQELLKTDYAHQEKLVALGTLVAGVAHEVNNPLTALLLSTEGLKLRVAPLHEAYHKLEKLLEGGEQVSREALLEVLAIGRTGADLEECTNMMSDAVSAADAIARVVKDLTVFARQDDDAAPSVIDLTALLDQVLRMVGRQVRMVASVELDYPNEPPMVVAPSARLAQVFTNLLLNAVHAMEEHPSDAHRVRISVRSDDEAVAVSITDTGPGISPGVIERIFDPFFTTKRQKEGTGLGLSISRSILKRLGGDLVVESVHGQGATFVALIPAPDREDILRAWRGTIGSSAAESSEPDHCRLLVVDDDERVLRSFARSLDDRHTLLLARDAQEALALLDSGSHADVVVADSSPPTRAGVTLFEQLRMRNSPLANALVLVVNPDEERDAAVVACGRTILTKPVDRASLASAVTEALKRYPPGAQPRGSTL